MRNVSELTEANPHDREAHTCTHVLGDKCGESRLSVRVVIRLPSINTGGRGGG